MYLALHAAKHLFHRISWLYDLKLLIRSQPSLNWDRVSEIAREAEMEGPTYFALEAAQRTMDANVPPRILATLKPASWQRAIGRHIFSEQQLTSSAYAERRHFRYLLRALLASSSETMAAEALSLSRQALQRIFEHHLPGWFRSLLPSTNSLPASHDKIGSRW